MLFTLSKEDRRGKKTYSLRHSFKTWPRLDLVQGTTHVLRGVGWLKKYFLKIIKISFYFMKKIYFVIIFFLWIDQVIVNLNILPDESFIYLFITWISLDLELAISQPDLKFNFIISDEYNHRVKVTRLYDFIKIILCDKKTKKKKSMKIITWICSIPSWCDSHTQVWIQPTKVVSCCSYWDLRMKVCHKINGEIQWNCQISLHRLLGLKLQSLAQSTRLKHCSIGPEPIILRPTLNSIGRIVLH